MTQDDFTVPWTTLRHLFVPVWRAIQQIFRNGILSSAALGSCVLGNGFALERSKPDQFSSLIANSPFGQQQQSQEPSAPEIQVEFRGYVVEDGETLLSLWLPNETGGKARSYWVKPGGTAGAITVSSFDSGRAEVTLVYPGGGVTLPLKRAKISAMATAAPENAQAVAQSGNPSEAQRLESIAGEIRRRRALRQQQSGRG